MDRTAVLDAMGVTTWQLRDQSVQPLAPVEQTLPTYQLTRHGHPQGGLILEPSNHTPDADALLHKMFAAIEMQVAPTAPSEIAGDYWLLMGVQNLPESAQNGIKRSILLTSTPAQLIEKPVLKRALWTQLKEL